MKYAFVAPSFDKVLDKNYPIQLPYNCSRMLYVLAINVHTYCTLYVLAFKNST